MFEASNAFLHEWTGAPLFGQSSARHVFVAGWRVLTLRSQGSGTLSQGHFTLTLGAIFCTYQRVVAGLDAPMEADGLDDGSRLRRDRQMRDASRAYNINEKGSFEDTASRGLDLARRRGAVVPGSGRAS